jgi:CRP-like cAMP-binding protein
MRLGISDNVVPLHGDFPDQRLHMTQLTPGQTLFWEGDEANQLFRIESGVVRSVNFSAEGERQVTGFFFPGDVIGLPRGHDYRYTAEAVTEVSYSTQPLKGWSEEMRCTRDLNDALFGTVQPELEAGYMRSLLLGRQGALVRMCSFLADVCARIGNGEETVLPMPQTDIAAYLAMTPETVCRTFRKLKDIGTVRIEKHDCIRILEPGRIAQLASH